MRNLLQKKAWHPLFRLDELSLDTIKRNLDAARAAEATKQLNDTGIAAGKSVTMHLLHAASCSTLSAAVVAVTATQQ